MANWQDLLKLEKEQEFLDSLSTERRDKFEARMKDRDSEKYGENEEYLRQVQEILDDPKIDAMESELAKMKKEMDAKATELMSFVWDNDKNPIDADGAGDTGSDGYKAAEKLSEFVERILEEFGGYKPW